MFVGDYFTMMTTVVLTEEHRKKDESDEDFACRLASILMLEFYGWDVASVSTDIGIVDDD